MHFRYWSLKNKIMLVYCIIVCMQSTVRSFAQTLSASYLPNIVPPSPEAAALGKYGQVPVDKSTGIPNISVPLYEITTPRFKLPISLSYYAAGIKVDETPGWAGLGWALNAGGVITRSIVGLPDEIGYLLTNVPKAADVQFSRDSLLLLKVLHHQADVEPDNFYYNFNDQSGAFVFGEDKKPLLTRYKPLQFTFSTTDGFQVVDESGNKYFFNDKESISTDAASGICSWYLSKMISADLSDTIQFSYATDPTYLAEFSRIFSQTVGGSFDIGCNSFEKIGTLTSTLNLRNINTIHLSQILFKNGKVDFKSITGRLDNGLVALDSVIVSNYDYKSGGYIRLKSFKMNLDYFVSTGSSPYGNRLRLSGITENDNKNAAAKKYSFDYNSTPLPPIHSYGQDQWGYYNGKDGNQSLMAPQSVLATQGTSIFSIGGSMAGDRSVQPAYMQAGMLQRIHYPTQGFTEFTFEPNQYILNYEQSFNQVASAVGVYGETFTATFTVGTVYNSYLHIVIPHIGGLSGMTDYPFVRLKQVSNGAIVNITSAQASNDINFVTPVNLIAGETYELYAEAKGNSQASASIMLTYTNSNFDSMTAYGPGLRINAIKNYDANGSILGTETYKYGNNESGQGILLSGVLAFSPDVVNKVVNKVYALGINQGGGACTRCTVSSRVFYSTSDYPLSTLGGSPVAYPTVTVYQGDPSINVGKSIYDYGVTPDMFISSEAGYTGVPFPVSYSWKNGQEAHEAHYKNDGTNHYILVKERQNIYTDIERTSGRGLRIGYLVENGGGDCQLPYWSTDISYYDYPISSGTRLPSQTIDMTYDQNSNLSVQDTTKYYYDNLTHLYPTRIVHFNSKGDSIQKQMNYPQDMVNAGKDPTGIYQNMTTKNIISPAIETTETQDGTLPLSRIRNNYFLTTASNPALQNVEVQTGSNPSEIRVVYNSYDRNNNVVSVSKANDINTSYIWGYNYSLPVAKVVNADSISIAYTSFESETNGNWTVAGIQRDTTTAITGNASYDIAHGNISKGGLTAGRVYLVSYWSKTGSKSISGGTSVTSSGKTVNGWTYFEHKVTATSSTISLSGSGMIDELRLYPATAQMATYTYTPLIGMTSQCDVNNRVTYYTYDGLQRLQYVMDQDGNIIKTVEYHYQSQ